MTTKETAAQLTPSLEDYLETIFELVRDRRVAPGPGGDGRP